MLAEPPCPIAEAALAETVDQQVIEALRRAVEEAEARNTRMVVGLWNEGEGLRVVVAVEGAPPTHDVAFDALYIVTPDRELIEADDAPSA
jgi:hypothetical protein